MLHLAGEERVRAEEEPPARVSGDRPPTTGNAVFVTEHGGRARWVTVGGWSIALLAAAWMLTLGAGIPGFVQLPGVRPGLLRVQRDTHAPRGPELAEIGRSPSPAREARPRPRPAGAPLGVSESVARTDMVDYQPPATERSAPTAPAAHRARPPRRAERRTTSHRRPTRRARSRRRARSGLSSRPRARARANRTGGGTRLRTSERRLASRLV